MSLSKLVISSKEDDCMEKSKLTGKAQAVLGPIPSEELGITLPHEHLLIDLSIMFNEPNTAKEKRLAHQPVRLENLRWIITL